MIENMEVYDGHIQKYSSRAEKATDMSLRRFWFLTVIDLHKSPVWKKKGEEK